MAKKDSDSRKLYADIVDDVILRVVVIVIAVLVMMFGHFVFENPIYRALCIGIPGVLLVLCVVSIVSLLRR